MLEAIYCINICINNRCALEAQLKLNLCLKTCKKSGTNSIKNYKEFKAFFNRIKKFVGISYADDPIIEDFGEIKFESFTEEVTREVKVYTEEDHLNHRSELIKGIYEKIKERVLELDDIDIEVKKMYIAFKGSRNIIDLEFYKSKITMFINMKKGTLNDPLNITTDLSNCGHHGNGDYCVDITNIDMIDNLIPLIKQSLEVNKK